MDEFEGMDAAALEAAAKQANAENKMMAKATKDLSDDTVNSLQLALEDFNKTWSPPA